MNTQTTRQTDSDPWYRNGIVWLIIMIPATSVIMGSVLLTLAIKHYDGVVIDDYYKRGKYINKIIHSNNTANPLTFEVTFDNKAKSLSVSSAKKLVSERIKIGFYHITHRKHDKITLGNRQPDGTYRATLPELRENTWYYLQIESKLWKLSKRIQYKSTVRHLQLSSTGE